ncbi:MAG: hypothetical protein ETSY2_48045, partial [Candidatus Entotheonella gemina]
NAPLNRWFGRLWTFTGGWASYWWYHAHVLVHHKNLLAECDWTLPKYDSKGRHENLYVYMMLHWPWRYGLHLWRDYRAASPSRRRKFEKETAIFAVLWSIPFWIDPWMGLWLWVLPHFFANCRAMGPGMYLQHVDSVAKTETQPYSHSTTYTGKFFNLLNFNIGYHLEHHDYPQLHWSQLPALHRELLPELTAHGAKISHLGYHRGAGQVYLRDFLALFGRQRGQRPGNKHLKSCLRGRRAVKLMPFISHRQGVTAF